MQYRIAICDDSEEDTEYLSKLVSDWAESASRTAKIQTFASAEQFLFENESNNPFDILLLDVEMRSVTGIDLAKRIRKSDRRAEIIFTTSHFEFIGEGYEVDALHYLIKPVKAEKLREVLSRAAELLSVEPASVLFQCNGETLKLAEDQITYIEAFLHYIVIHTEKEEYKIKENISAFASRLSERFFRIHRSYIVSLTSTVSISRSGVTLADGTELPLSRGLYEAVNRAFIRQN